LEFGYNCRNILKKLYMKLRLKGFLLLSCLLAFVGSALAQKQYKGLLWEVWGNGMEYPSYLYGTMHVSNKVAFQLTDSFFIGLKECDVVALETNPQEWLSDMDKMGYFKEFLPSNYVYGSGFYEEGFELGKVEHEDLVGALARENAMINSLLSRVSSGNEDFSEQTYLDLFIYQAGLKQGKTAVNLEGYEESFMLGMRADVPDMHKEAKKKEALRGYKLSEMREKGKNASLMIEEAYRRGNLGTIDSLMNLTSSERNKMLFLTRRNVNMMNRMDSLMKKKHRVFAGIGAAHLPGDSGAIELLRNMGYKVRAMRGEKTKKGEKMWAKINKRFIDKPLDQTFTSSDGLFKVNVPGFMIEMPGGDHGKDYLYADMANGAYYTISRLNLYNFVDNKTQETIELGLDSAFNLSIPGEILSKERTTRFGYPCYDIKNKTATGDYQRYQVIITPLELFVFKVGGPGKFVKITKHSDDFFNSIRFIKKPSKGWENFVSEKSGFSVELPQYHDRKGAENYGAKSGMYHNLIQAYDGFNKDHFLVMQRALHDVNYIEDDSFELRMIVDAFKEEHKYKVTSRELGKLDTGHPWFKAHLSSEEKGEMDIMCVLKGPQYFVLMSRTENEAARDRFFNSFKVQRSVSSLPIVTVRDTALLFEVQTVRQQGTKFRPYILRRSKGRYSYRKTKKYEASSKDHDFFNIQTAEVIDLGHYKYHDYYELEADKEYWNDVQDGLIDDDYQGLAVEKFETVDEEGYKVVTFDVSDSSSHRKIYGMFLWKGGVVYTAKTCYDGLLGLSDFQKQFFETFKPFADTSAGVDVFSDKGDYMLGKLNSKDSTDRKAAFASLYRYSYFKDDQAERMIKFIDSYDFDEDEDHKKYQAEIMEELGYLKDRADYIIPYCIDKYKASAEDRPDLQFAALQVLAELETKEAIKAFRELVVEDPPLTQGNDILYIFYRLDDSLELAVDLYPSLLDLTEFEEYETYVYRLLAATVDSGLTDGSIYKGQLRNILKEAKYALKRQQSRDQTETKSDIYDDYFDADYYESIWSRHELSYFTSLLIPFKSEPDVAKLLNDMLKIEDKELKLHLALMHLNAGMDVAAEVLEDLQEKDEDLPLLYDNLKNIERTDLMDEERTTQYLMAKGRLFAGYDDEKDSIEFIKTQEYTTNEGRAGVIYLFKSKEEDDEEWELNFVAYTFKNSTKAKSHIKTRYDYYKKGISFNDKDEEDLNDKIKDYVKWLSVKDHKRVADLFRSNYSSYFNF